MIKIRSPAVHKKEKAYTVSEKHCISSLKNFDSNIVTQKNKQQFKNKRGFNI